MITQILELLNTGGKIAQPLIEDAVAQKYEKEKINRIKKWREICETDNYVDRVISIHDFIDELFAACGSASAIYGMDANTGGSMDSGEHNTACTHVPDAALDLFVQCTVELIYTREMLARMQQIALQK